MWFTLGVTCLFISSCVLIDICMAVCSGCVHFVLRRVPYLFQPEIRRNKTKQKNKVDGSMVIYGFVNIEADHDVVQRALWSRAVDSERLDLLYPPIIQKCSYIPCAPSALPLPTGSVLMWQDCVKRVCSLCHATWATGSSDMFIIVSNHWWNQWKFENV